MHLPTCVRTEVPTLPSTPAVAARRVEPRTPKAPRKRRPTESLVGLWDVRLARKLNFELIELTETAAAVVGDADDGSTAQT